MTPEQKVSLVEAVKDTYGLNLALAAVDLPKSTWYYHQNDKVDYEEKYAHLRAILEAIARKYPEYGLPRIMAELRDVYHCQVNHKVVERLLGLWDLSILRGTRRRKPSGVQRAILEAGEQANLVAQMAEIGLFQVLYTDFTELLYAEGCRKAILMPIIGHASKMAFGWAVGESDDTGLALQAWERAKRAFQELNVSCAGMVMHHDRDPVYTGYGWTSQLLLKDELRLSYALRGAKDNPEMESFNGRFKTEGHSLFLEARSLDGLVAVVDDRMRYYNTERRHSSIGYVPPLTYIERTLSNLNAQH
jgi:transposase InsO family protein